MVEAQVEDIEQRLDEISKIEDKSQAIIAYTQLLQTSGLTPRQQYSIYYQISYSYFVISNYPQALLFNEQALDIANQFKLNHQRAKSYKLLGIIHYYSGDNEAAISAYQKSIKILIALEFPIEQANLYNNMALAHTAMGEYVKAISAYEKAEPLYHQYGDEMDKVDIRANLAVLYLHLERHDVAIELLHEVIEKRIGIKDESGLAQAYAHIGVAYKHSQQYSNAEHYSNKALDYFIGVNNMHQVASQYHNLADLYSRLNDFEKVNEYADKALQLSEKLGIKKVQAGALYTSAIASFVNDDWVQALSKIERSNQIAKSINYSSALMDNLALTSLIESRRGENLSAISTYYQYNFMHNQAYSTHLDQQLAKFEAQQLSQQVRDLEQNKKIHAYKQSQQEYFGLLGISLIIALVTLAFLLYRRHIDAALKKELEVSVTQRTLELEVANKKLYQLSFVDGSTSLFNRRSFDVDILEAWQAHVKQENSFLLLIASIDQFNIYNNIHGHLASEKVLKKVAKLLKARVADYGKVYRFSGDDLAVIFERNSMAHASSLFEQVLTELEALSIEHSDSSHKKITLSAGICSCDDQVQSIEQLIAKVDQRLYIAKKTGRNQVINQVIRAKKNTSI